MYIAVALSALSEPFLYASMRGWRNTVGNLIEALWLKKTYHGLQITGICAKHTRVRFHRIRDFKQYSNCMNINTIIHIDIDIDIIIVIIIIIIIIIIIVIIIIIIIIIMIIPKIIITRKDTLDDV